MVPSPGRTLRFGGLLWSDPGTLWKRMARMTAIPLEDDTFYPEADGEPMAETELHLEEMVYAWEALSDRFEDQRDVFVGANLFLYYRPGDRRAVVAPDCFVVKGAVKL